ncbi:MAG: hypothetical protein ACREV9_08230 [Burkholderiales bacterium]
MLRVLVLLLLSLGKSSAAAEIQLTIEDVIAPNFKLQGVTAKLVGDHRLDLKISELSALDRMWRNVTLSCGKFELDSSHVRCEQGTANVGKPIAVNFDYDLDSGKIKAELAPSRGEKWRVDGRYQTRGWNFKVMVENGGLEPLAQWLPRTLPKISAGVLDGSFVIAESATGYNSLSADLALASLAFSDESGLHAGEKVGGKVLVEAKRDKAKWDWNLDVLWDNGEAFWEPIYLKGEGHRLGARGEVRNSEVEITEALLTLNDIGDFAFVGRGRDGKITEAGVAAEKIALPRLYEVVLKPFLEKTALNDLRTTGLIDFALRYVNGEITGVNVGLDDVSLEDKKQRFGAFGVDAKVPWNRYAQTSAKIRLEGGEIFRVPLGKIELPVAMHGFSFATDSLEIPILDGALRLNDFRARRENEAWQWSFSGGVAPISMQELTNTLNVTTMRGTLAGTIPRVTYERSTIAVEGALLLRVFDGMIEVKDLKLFEPLGIAPTLNTNVEMKRLDLDLLTRAYSFGNITGRIDVSVNDLALVNWKPVRFDAKLASSEGSYPRKISQTAVENISALGGASAAAAIQRSVLRFFDRFGYSRLGWNCSLANGICEMGGIEPAGQGYLIVEGGGVPQITVLGYNRRVNWDELVARLQRVTRSKPVIQ